MAPDPVLDEVLARTLIDDLQRRYADVVTRRAWDELSTLFRPDTTVEVDTVSRPAVRLVGPEAFADFVAPAVARFDFFAFVILSAVVDLGPGPGEARGRIFMCELRHDAATGRRSTAYGRYLDRYVHDGDRWWFAERRYRSLARTAGADAPATDGPELDVLGDADHGWPT